MSTPVSETRAAGVQRAVALVAASGAFLAFLDATIVNIAFPDIAASFPDATRSQLSWVLDAYFVVIAAFLVPAGGLADRYGVRRTFLLSLLGFGLTSVLCALAPGWETLVAARVLQGVTAAVIAPVSLTLVVRAFPEHLRSSGVALAGAASALAAAIGPTLGGFIVEVADWRWIFAINLPLTAVIAGLALRFVPSDTPDGDGLPDLAASALVALALGALTLAIVEAPTWGWTSSRTLGSAALALMGLAVVWRRSASHPRPIVPPRLWRDQGMVVGNVGTLLFAMAFFATILGNVLFLTSVWGYTALQAGAASVPGPVMSTLLGGVSGRLADRWGARRVVVAGVPVYAAGLGVLGSAGARPDFVGLWLWGMALTGTGVGLAFPTLGAVAVEAAPLAGFATASAVNAAFRQVGAALGTAILVAIVGTPLTLAAAETSADHAYGFAAGAALASGVVALLARPLRRPTA